MFIKKRLSALALSAVLGASVVPTIHAEEAPATAAAEMDQTELVEMLGYLTVFQSGMKELGFTVADADAISAGIKRGLADAQPDPAISAKMPAFQEFIGVRVEAAEAKLAAENAQAAEANSSTNATFFEDLKGQEDVESSPSGLFYKVVEAGSDLKPSMEDTVLVHYKGTLIDGTKFDSSYDRGEPASFPLNGVVKGFGEGLTKVGVGGKIILYIPSDLGYGDSPRPGGPIKAGDTLIFECELIEINPGS
jgi:FKBP-type peptidyl-prolyl cis-trans isomerase FkpA